MGMWIFQINLRSAYGLHVPHFIVSVSCSVGLVLVWSWSWLGLALPWSWSWLGLDPSKSWSCLGLDTLWSWSWLGLGLGGLDYNTGVQTCLWPDRSPCALYFGCLLQYRMDRSLNGNMLTWFEIWNAFTECWIEVACGSAESKAFIFPRVTFGHLSINGRDPSHILAWRTAEGSSSSALP